MLLDVGLQICGEVELLGCLGVSLKELYGKPSLLFLRNKGLNGLLDVGDGVLHASCEDVGQLSLFLGSLGNGELCGLSRVVGVQGTDLDRLAAKLLSELCRVDPVTVLADQIHHVEGDDHRNADLHELGREIQVSLDVGSVDDVQDDIGLLIDEVVSGDDLLKRVGA